MKLRSYSIKKTIALTLALCLAVNGKVSATFTEPPQLHTAETSFLYELPKSLGVLQSFPPAETQEGPMVINIQDAHTNPSAQKNIRLLLEWLNQNFDGHLLVGMEGARGEIHPEYLNIFKDLPELNQTIVNDLIAKGELNGVEQFALENKSLLEHKTFIRGIENSRLYRRNLMKYRQLLDDREQIEIELLQLRKPIESLSLRLLSPELNEFLKERERRKEGRYDAKPQEPQIETYFRFLRQSARKHLSIDLENSIEQLRYPQMFALVALEKVSEGYQSEAAEKELLSWKSAVESKNKIRGAQELIAAIVDLAQDKNPRARIEELWRFMEKHGFSLSPYPQLKKRLGIQVLRSEINVQALWHEFSQIEDLIIHKLTRNLKEKNLLLLIETLGGLEKLLYAELSHDEFEAMSKRFASYEPARFLKAAKALGASFDSRTLHSAKKLSVSFVTAVEFYRLAKKRDRVLFVNAFKYARDLQLPRSHSQAIIVIVSGGFHTPGLSNNLRAYGVPHGVIQPMITSFESQDALAKVYRDENIDLKNFDISVPLSKQQALFLSQIFTTGAEYLLSKKQLTEEGIQKVLIETAKNHPVLSGSFDINSFELSNNKDIARKVIAVKTDVDAIQGQKAIAETSLLMRPSGYTRQRGWSSRSFQPLRRKGTKRIRVSPRSEVRVSDKEIEKLLNPMIGLISIQNGRQRIEQMKSTQESLDKNNGITKPRLIEHLQKVIPKKSQDSPNAAIYGQFLRYLLGTKIGIYGLDETSRATAVMLTRIGHDVTVADAPEKVQGKRQEAEAFYARFGETYNSQLIQVIPVEDAHKVEGDKNREAKTAREEVFFNMLRDNNIIYVDTGLDLEGDYKLYLEHLEGRAMDFGNALRRLRDEEKAQNVPYSHKVFITRALVDQRTISNMNEKIRYHTKTDDLETLNYNLVYQPDLIRYESDQLTEPYVMFGLSPLRARDSVSAAIELTQRNKTIDLLNSIYLANPHIQPQFVSLESAIEAKDDLMIYLATKLTFFNDLAGLSDKFGADLSIIAKGAGLDKRIQTLFANPSQAFGGRLLVLLEWIQQKNLKSLDKRTVGATTYKETEISNLLSSQIKALDRGDSIDSVVSSLPKEFRRLFWVRLLVSINKRTANQFLDQKIIDYFHSKGGLKNMKVALLGVGYSHKSGKTTKSPALELIERLVIDHGVTKFVIADPQAKVDFERWVEGKRMEPEYKQYFGAVNFHGINDEPEMDIYDAVKKSDLAIIATDANPEIFNLDLQRLKESLGDKPLFDGINLFGLRANGELANGMREYRLENIRKLGINYISVGRPSILSINSRAQNQSHYLADARIYHRAEEFPSAELTELFGEAGFEVALTGGGYVGLTTAGLYGELGHRVHVVDVPQAQKRIEGLNSDEMIVPIYEPGLRDQLKAGRDLKKLTFTTDKTKPIREALVNILAVGTPQKDDGEIDLSYILNAAEETGLIIQQMKNERLPEKYPGIPAHFKIITIKSTVTPDTFDKIKDRLLSLGLQIGVDYALASMPEFLKEGTAVDDVRFPDRTVIGIYSGMPVPIKRFTEFALLNLSYPLMKKHPHPVLVTDTSTSTLIKYAANSLLAVSISLANIFAQEAELADADYFAVRAALAADDRISRYAFLFPGCGYGGSCFPKDVRALDTLSRVVVNELLGIPLISMADNLNERFKDDVIDKVVKNFTNSPHARAPLANKYTAIWGLAFKPNTDDVRESPAARMVARLIQKGVTQIKLHDPIFNIESHLREPVEKRFIEELEKTFKKTGLFDKSRGDFAVWLKKEFLDTGRIEFATEAEDALWFNDKKADALVLATDWPQYKKKLEFLTKMTGTSLLLMDARNLWNDKESRELIADAGSINYRGIGTQSIFAAPSPRSEVRFNFKGSTAEFRSFIDKSFPAKPNFSAWPLTAVANLFTYSSLGNFLSRFEGVDAALGFARQMWPEEKTAADPGMQQNKIVALAKDILGKEYFDLLFTVNGPAIHILTKAPGKKITDGSLLWLAAAGKNDSLTHLIEGTPQAAAKIEESFEAKAIKLGLPSSIRSSFSVIASPATSHNATTLKRKVAADLRRVGFVDEQMRFLERIGYVPGTYRFLRERMSLDSAISLSAILLRNQLPDAMFIKNIRQELEARNLNPDVLAERMGKLIAAIRHIATQA